MFGHNSLHFACGEIKTGMHVPFTVHAHSSGSVYVLLSRKSNNETLLSTWNNYVCLNMCSVGPGQARPY